MEIPTFHNNHSCGYVALLRELYTELSMGNLRELVRGERGAVMESYLGILLEEKTLVADLEHKNDTWVLILYA